MTIPELLRLQAQQQQQQRLVAPVAQSPVTYQLENAMPRDESQPIEPQVHNASHEDEADFELYDAIQEDAAVRHLRSEFAIHMLQDGYLDML